MSKFSLLDKISAILAVCLLLCLFPMPYGFYTLIRFASFIIFGWMAYTYYKEKQTGWMVLFGALALLFQPFAMIALGRLMWNIVDVLVAALIGFILYKKYEKK